MKFFADTFKLYAYKNRDRCDLSIKVNDVTALTFKLTHDEIRRLFEEYSVHDPANNQYGVQFTSKSGQHWFVMDKRHFQVIRITIGNQGVDFNFRVSYNNWNLLKLTYEQQMSNPMPWDEK